jgi:hypothetical protein
MRSAGAMASTRWRVAAGTPGLLLSVGDAVASDAPGRRAMPVMLAFSGAAVMGRSWASWKRLQNLGRP